jgi:hypothetical protein
MSAYAGTNKGVDDISVLVFTCVFKMNVIGFSLICRLHIFYFRMWIVSLSCSVPRHQKPNKIIEEAVWPLR